MSRSIKYVLSATLAGGLAFASTGCGPKPAPVAIVPPATNPAPQVMPVPPMVMPGPPAPAPNTPPAPVEQPGGLIGGQGLPVDPSGSAAVPSVPTIVPDPPATPTEVVKADVGVGLKGRSLDQLNDPISTPAKAYFAVREKAIFQIQIPHALQLFKAADGTGPKSHEEFMQRIIQENKIKLPQLPPGHTYEYNPETEELMVKRPMKP